MNQLSTIIWGQGPATEDVYREAMMASAAKSPRTNFPAQRKKYAEPSKTYRIILRMASTPEGFAFSQTACKLLEVKEKALRSELTRMVCKGWLVAEKDERGRNKNYHITSEGRHVLNSVGATS